MPTFDYQAFRALPLPDQDTVMADWPADFSEPVATISCITYNHAKYLDDAIRGFLLQKTNFPFEIIIHDDASTDETAAIIGSYAAKYPRIFRPLLQKENQFRINRRISARHVWPHARGEFLALCEGDDYWTRPDKLQMQVDFLRTHPDYYVTMGGLLRCREGEFAPCESRWDPTRTEFDVKDYICKMFGHTSNICCRRHPKSWEIPCDYDILQGDQHFVLFQATAGCDKIKFFDATLSVYRDHPTGVTKTRYYNDYANSLGSYKAILQHFDLHTEGRYAKAVRYRLKEVELLQQTTHDKLAFLVSLLKPCNLGIFFKYLLRKQFGLRPF